MLVKNFNHENAFFLVHNIHFLNNFTYITEVGYSVPPNGRRVNPRVLDTYLMHFIISGECTFNGETLHPGEGYLVYPNQPYEFIVGDSGLFEHCWLIFNGDNIEQTLNTLNFKQNDHKFTYNNVELLKSNIFMFFDIASKTNISMNHMLGIFYTLISYVNIPEPINAFEQNTTYAHVQDAISYIKANFYNSDLSLNSNCSLYSFISEISESYFFRNNTIIYSELYNQYAC